MKKFILAFALMAVLFIPFASSANAHRLDGGSAIPYCSDYPYSYYGYYHVPQYSWNYNDDGGYTYYHRHVTYIYKATVWGGMSYVGYRTQICGKFYIW